MLSDTLQILLKINDRSYVTERKEYKTLKIWLSDHFLTCIVLKDSFGLKWSYSSIKFRLYKQFELETCVDK